MKKLKYLKFDHETTLKDALYNLAPNSGASLDYCTGLTVGVVSSLMAVGLNFKQAIDTVACYMPHKSGTRLAVPESWLIDLGACLLERGVYLHSPNEVK